MCKGLENFGDDTKAVIYLTYQCVYRVKRFDGPLPVPDIMIIGENKKGCVCVVGTYTLHVCVFM